MDIHQTQKLLFFYVLITEIHATTDMNSGSDVIRLPAPGMAEHVCDSIFFTASMISHKDSNT